jgi:hypothetical protein
MISAAGAAGKICCSGSGTKALSRASGPLQNAAGAVARVVAGGGAIPAAPQLR